MLKDQTTSTRVKGEIIRSLANSQDGARAVPNFVEYLGSSEEELRNATARTLLKLYGLDPKTVSASLSRTLLTSKDEVLLVEGTRILSQIADQDTVNTLITLLSSPYPEVKKHATWALYRIRPAGNAKVIDELKKLVTGETESLEVRINAVRGLGAIGSLTPNATPQTAVWPTILTALKMRDEKYTMLRFYAVRALGDVRVADEEIIDTLVRTVSREQDAEIKREAVESLRKLSGSDERAEKALSDLLKSDGSPELKLAVAEALRDMGSPLLKEAASLMAVDGFSTAQKKRLLYALSRSTEQEAYTALIDATKDEKLKDFALALLDDADTKALADVVLRRIQTENDKEVLAVLEYLKGNIDEKR
jgi:HEAT repeat protein